MNKHLTLHLARRCAEVNRALDSYLPTSHTKPISLHRAMRYSVFAGGKRLRPILCLEAAEACGGNTAATLPIACAIECIHTYSLIHDDLPCMDDDDLRRGKPTAHVKFGEALALLSGDALLTQAFEIAAQSQGNKRYSGADFVSVLAVAAGSKHLIAGQVADLSAEGCSLHGKQLRSIHLEKTAAMVAASLRLGAMSAGATLAQCEALANFGENLGLAFQVVDDILDITQTSDSLGKSAGKDIRDKKSTYPAALGIEGAQSEAEKLTQAALLALDPLGKCADRLRQIALTMLARKK